MKETKIYKMDLNSHQEISSVSCPGVRNLGIYQNKKTPCPYKKHIYLNDIPNQRQVFESNFNDYMKQWFEYAKLNNIL